jgi:hypothetical protein
MNIQFAQCFTVRTPHLAHSVITAFNTLKTKPSIAVMMSPWYWSFPILESGMEGFAVGRFAES